MNLEALWNQLHADQGSATVEEWYANCMNAAFGNLTLADRLRTTLGNMGWINTNRSKLLAAFPAEWTVMTEEIVDVAGYNFKLLGIDWRGMDELQKIFTYLDKLKLIEGRIVNGQPQLRICTHPSNSPESIAKP